MMQAETGAIVGRIGDASNRLSEHTRGLLKDIESSNVLTVEQQAETDQIATAVNQMVASIQEVASNAQHAADAAGRADTETASGQRLVAHTSQSITALEGEIRQATQVIHELEGQSNEISKVLDVIRGIAEQTNLLALNAAIEAARAGEQGVVLLLSPMRFAVLLLSHTAIDNGYSKHDQRSARASAIRCYSHGAK